MDAGEPDRDHEDAPERYQGFSLKSVCWGYRDIFARAIDGLFADGLLGGERVEVTAKAFELLKKADKACFDHVLKEFLGALNPRTRWLMDLPEVFSAVVDLGAEASSSKLYFGMSYFRALGRGELGQTPADVRLFVDCARRLLAIDHDLAFAFVRGFHKLRARLSASELHIYIDYALEAFARNRATGIGYMELSLKGAQEVAKMLSRESRLSDVTPRLSRLLRALVGYEVEVQGLSKLDSDELIEHDTRMVCMYQWLFVPDKLRYFERVEDNRRWYRLAAVTGAAALLCESFSRIHGHPSHTEIGSITGTDRLLQNVLIAVEYARVLRRIERDWPGARALIRFGVETEFSQVPPRSGPDRLAGDLFAARGERAAHLAQLLSIADESVNVFDTLARLESIDRAALAEAYPGLGSQPLRSFAFLPDWRYTGDVSTPPSDQLVADMKSEAQRRGKNRSDDEEDGRTNASSDGDREGDEERDDQTVAAAGYLYDEWSQEQGDYFRDYCIVHEQDSSAPTAYDLPEEARREADEVRKLFERLRPRLPSKEVHLEDGDAINEDHLVRYLVERRVEAQPRPDFYERVRINKRDLAVLILLDVSGSTGESHDADKVIDLEKRAALAVGHGIAALGDAFAICGFSGSGRENCEYIVYKSFDDSWDRDAERRVWSARPLTSTRIGAALRHAGYRLSLRGERQRLIMLVTDGKPMDAGYDPQTRYAQHDVRVACVENERQAVNTIGISTDANTIADMEVMFPHRRFIILPDMSRLPALLPQLYAKLVM